MGCEKPLDLPTSPFFAARVPVPGRQTQDLGTTQSSKRFDMEASVSSRYLRIPWVAALLLWSCYAYPLRSDATAIYYELASLGGNTWRYIYTVVNDNPPLGQAIEWFQIQFPGATALTAASGPSITSRWDEAIFPEVLGVEPATYDVLARLDGIGSGQHETGFAVDFSWTGTGLPASQSYSILDPASLGVIADGQTLMAAGTPVPGSLWLIAPAVMVLNGWRHRVRTCGTGGSSLTGPAYRNPDTHPTWRSAR